MPGALVILAALIVIGLLLFLTDKAYYSHGHTPKKPTNRDVPDSTSATVDNAPGEGGVVAGNNESASPAENETHGEFCCGLHAVCEKTGLSPIGDEIIYYDDEELDRFVGRSPEGYSEEEKEEFREVLLTLLPEDVPGWARSITLRRIELPTEIRDELLLIVSDLRSLPNS